MKRLKTLVKLSHSLITFKDINDQQPPSLSNLFKVRDVPHGLRSKQSQGVECTPGKCTLCRVSPCFLQDPLELLLHPPGPQILNHNHSLSSMVIIRVNGLDLNNFTYFVCSRSRHFVRLSRLLGQFFKIKLCLNLSFIHGL